MTDAEPAVTVNDLVRDHNLAFVEIIEKVKEGGAINAVFVDATVDADAPNCGFPMEHTEYKIKHSTPTGTFFTATAGNRTFRVSPDTATDAFIVSFTIKAGEGSKRPSRSSSKAGTAVIKNDLRQRRGAALLNKVAAFANPSVVATVPTPLHSSSVANRTHPSHQSHNPFRPFPPGDSYELREAGRGHAAD